MMIIHSDFDIPDREKLAASFKRYRNVSEASSERQEALGMMLRQSGYLNKYLSDCLSSADNNDYICALLLHYKTQNSKEIAKLNLLAEKFYAFVSNLTCEPAYKHKLYKVLADTAYLHQGAQYYIHRKMQACLNLEDAQKKKARLAGDLSETIETVHFRDLCTTDINKPSVAWTDLITVEQPTYH